MPLEKVIFADGDENLRRTVAEFIRTKRIDVAEAGAIHDVYNYLGKDNFDLIFLDSKLPECDCLDFLGDLNQRSEKPLVITLTNNDSESFSLNCMKAGAFDYLAKPFSQGQIEIALKKADNFNRVFRVNAALNSNEVDDAEREILGDSGHIADLRQLIKRVAMTHVTVMIQGESGTGKELVARALHRQSPRAGMPFIKINCAALPENLIESEFFGHEKGAFTGAIAKREGRFELAHGGTILLDEISEISLNMQAKLLRVLQEQEFERIGGNRTVKVDVRVIATTNRVLEQSVAKGEFRQDLFFRLNVVPILTPTLRERRNDTFSLAEQFLKRFSRKHGVQVRGFSEDSIAALEKHDWPGNVRELQNVVERAVILCNSDGIIQPEELNLPGYSSQKISLSETPRSGALDAGIGDGDGEEDDVGELGSPISPQKNYSSGSFPTLDEIEKQHILMALQVSKQKRSKAAEMLNINIRTLRNKINLYRDSAKSPTELEALGLDAE